MKSKIIISLLILFGLFFFGSGITMLYIYRTTSNLQSVINLHQVEIIRQNLVISAQTVQTHLYTIGTEFGQELDIIVDNVISLDEAVRNCQSCHHSPELTAKLTALQTDVEQFKDVMSSLITTSANKERMNRLRLVTIEIGTGLLNRVQEMAVAANQRLNQKTYLAIKEINNSRIILILTLVVSFFISLVIAISMTRQITEPIYELVDATRKIQAGDLGYQTSYKGQNEFGELMTAFNDMSQTLKDSNQKIMNHLHNLSNLYSVSLSFHAVSKEMEIYKELTSGAAMLVEAEQCGIMLLEGNEFVMKPSAVGLSEEEIKLFKVPKDAFLKLYGPTRKRAFILNGDISTSPTYEYDKQVRTRNLMFVWIRHKGEPIGVIRLANKELGNFAEEDIRLLAVLANNVSVAIENLRLYENLKSQMEELKNTQEQLVQAAKLAAIGELASNVAHEINNPLTSILGYAELIKEETELSTIMKDVEIIEKESLRAREIVRQLLEFSRKRSLSINFTDINFAIKEVIGLVSLQIKDTNIKVVENYGSLPSVACDINQMKQVFLNIINNAVFAMSEAENAVLGITTYSKDDNVYIEISDTGKGIPKEVMPRLFEPFFTTKKEKGTGLGLSISYKIVQSHSGKIDVESEEGIGTKFTITLPVVPRTIKTVETES